jgi:putative phosphoribosyl transferase
MTFLDRFDAGRQLAARLHAYREERPIVVGIARGGVAVALEVARALGAPLEIWIARRLYAPDDPEEVLGAVSEGGATELELGSSALPSGELDALVAREAELCDQVAAVLRGRPPLSLRGRSVILVDDGCQSGATIRAVTRSLRAHGPARLLLAVPVGAADVLDELRPDFDRVVCLEAPAILGAIGAWYRDFWRVSAAEVTSLLAGYERERAQMAGLARRAR